MTRDETRRRERATRRACDSVDDVVDAESTHRRCLALGRGERDESSRRWDDVELERERAAGDDGGDDDDDERDGRDERWDADETGATALA